MDTHLIGTEFSGLALSPELGLVAALWWQAPQVIVTLGPDTTTPLEWSGPPECATIHNGCDVLGLSSEGPASIFVAWTASVGDPSGVDLINLLTGDVTPVAGGFDSAGLSCNAGESAFDCDVTFWSALRLPDGSSLLGTGGAWLVVDATGTLVRRTVVDDTDEALDAEYAFDQLPGFGLGGAAVHGNNLYLVDDRRSVIWKVDLRSWTATWFAGKQLPITRFHSPPIYAGDDGPALDATFDLIRDIAVDEIGQIYVSDSDLIRVIGTDGIVRRLAGQPHGVDLPDGDGGLAIDATLWQPYDLTLYDGSLYFRDYTTSVRRIWLP